MSIERRYPLLKHDHDAADITSGVFSPGLLGSGTADSTKFLRGDSTWSDTLTGQFQLTFAGGGASSALVLASSTPFVLWDETDYGTDERRWDMGVNAGLFRFRSIDSAGNARNQLAFYRSGSGANRVDLGNATDNADYYLLGTGSLIVGGQARFANGTVGSPGISWSGDTDTGLWPHGGSNAFSAVTGGQERVRFWTGTLPLRIISTDTVGDAALGFYENDGTTQKGYIGYGSSVTDSFIIQNNENSELRFGTNGSTRLTIHADGGVYAVGATGDSQGVGTINATGVYDDGVLLANQSGANPTATIGLSAVNGSAGTFLRSDGAPALSQAIAPTWSALHIFASSSAEKLRLRSADTVGDVYLSFYDSASVRKGYFGFGDGATDRLYLMNEENAELAFGTNGSTRFTISGAGAGTFASSTFTVGGTQVSVVGHTHAAADTTSGTFSTARLGSGTANNTKYLRGDSVWNQLSGSDIAASAFTNAMTFSVQPAFTAKGAFLYYNSSSLASGNIIVQSGGSPSGGSDGDMYLIY